jgi:hypothetical protein
MPVAALERLRPAVGPVERQGLGDTLELDGSERVEPHLGSPERCAVSWLTTTCPACA